MAQRRTKTVKGGDNPIQEAILEVRFSPDNWDGTSAGRIFERMAKSFPEKREIRTLAFFVGPEPPSQLPPPQAPQMQLWSSDQSQLVQFGPGIIAANCVKYSTWNDFSPTLISIAKAYLQVVKPSTIMQISTRYINRFEFAAQELDLDQHFTCSITLPPMLQEIEGIQLNVTSPVVTAPKRKPQTLKVHFGSDMQSSDKSKAIFFLDIDCVSQVVMKPDLGEIQTSVDALHSTVKTLFKSFVRPTFRAAYLPEE